MLDTAGRHSGDRCLDRGANGIGVIPVDPLVGGADVRGRADALPVADPILDNRICGDTGTGDTGTGDPVRQSGDARAEGDEDVHRVGVDQIGHDD